MVWTRLFITLTLSVVGNAGGLVVPLGQRMAISIVERFTTTQAWLSCGGTKPVNSIGITVAIPGAQLTA